MINTDNAFNRVQTARHPDRPYTIDLLDSVFTDFIEIHGDRRFADDPAFVCGFAKLGEFDVAVVGQQKGRDMNQRRHRNFGMPKPEGYRKALRLMKLAEKFQRPVICIVDTPGAYPGIDAEERGQAEAIAFNLREMAGLKTSIVILILGEGGSGGALAIGVGDKVLMMENAVYSVISPEGCAAILWKDSGKASIAASSLKLTADELKSFGLIDKVIAEKSEWKVLSEKSEVNSDLVDETFGKVKDELIKALQELEKSEIEARLELRYKKFRQMGIYDVL